MAEHRDDDRARRRHPVLRRILYVVAFLLAGIIGFVAFAAIKLQSNISSIDISGALGRRPSVEATRNSSTDQLPLNILLVGSDTRNIADVDEFGGTNSSTTTAHSDTTILLHVAADRKSAYGISIPRDSMVHRPSCKNPDAVPLAQAPLGMFNAAYEDGGIGCTVMTVEANTGVRIDHYVVVNFQSFTSMVNALGGVDICLKQPVKDSYTGLKLPAGTSHLSGLQASQYVRARHGIGDGSDIGRMQRQQAFLSALIREATSSQLLLRPDKLYSFLDAATKSVTMDPDLASIRSLTSLAAQVQDISPGKIQFVTVPTAPYPPDPNRLEWLTAQSDPIWEAVRLDSPLPGQPGSKVGGHSTATAKPTVSPAAISVKLINSSGTSGLARQAGSALSAQGFVVTGYDTGSTADGVQIRYPAAHPAGAQTLLAAFPGATLTPSSSLTSSYEVVIGRGAGDVQEVPNRVGKGALPAQPLKAAPLSTSQSGSNPTLTPRVASDASCT